MSYPTCFNDTLCCNVLGASFCTGTGAMEEIKFIIIIFIIKVDQDTFVNLPLLLDALSLFSLGRSSGGSGGGSGNGNGSGNGSGSGSGFVLGHKHTRPVPPVSRSGKWQVRREDYRLPKFPRYVYGHSYVISGDAVRVLRHAAQRMPLVPNEDAYVTGVLAKSANVSRVDCQRFAAVWQLSRCSLVNGTDVSQTGFGSSAQLLRMWDMIKSGKC